MRIAKTLIRLGGSFCFILARYKDNNCMSQAEDVMLFPEPAVHFEDVSYSRCRLQRSGSAHMSQDNVGLSSRGATGCSKANDTT